MTTIETDILIVGGGIAGSALACALRQRGYHIVLVEQRRTPLDTARGDHVQPCNVEVLAQWGVLDIFFERGATKRIGHEFRTAEGEVLLTATYDELPIPYPYFLIFQHDQLAELFIELARENTYFLRLQPVVAHHFEREGEDIKALNVELPGGEQVLIKPHLVVGADGTNSTVRSVMKFAADKHHYQQPMLALFGSKPAALQPMDYYFRYSSPNGVLALQPRTNGTIKATLPIEQEEIAFWKQASAEQRASKLGKYADVMNEFESEIAGFYAAAMVHSQSYVKGNVVLAGDAAHSLHPARGQGLNMAIQSMQKLAECLPPANKIGNENALKTGLQNYQAYQKPLYDRIVARNHKAALILEANTNPTNQELIKKQDNQIREIHRSPELRRLHLLKASGYPFGIPAMTEMDLLV